MKKNLIAFIFLIGYGLSGRSQTLYTALPEGGSFGKGTLAKFIIGTNAAVAVHHFGSGSDGVNPQAVPIQAKDGKLYGTTNIGGLSNAGTLYSFNPYDSTYQKLFDFGGASGTNPFGNCGKRLMARYMA